MSVHYKFKSALEYDTVTFDGLHISVKDLKNSIVQQKRIGRNTDFDLQVTNAQTKEVYEDENALIAKNTSLLIARIPTATQTKNRQWEGYGGDATPPGKTDEGGPIARAVDLSSLDAPEDDKIKAMMSQSTQDYDPSNYMKIRGANQIGAVPPNYRCHKCHQTGHWIKDCPLAKDPQSVEIKKSTGIPLSFMVPVDGPQVQGAMMTPNGSYAVPVLDHQTYTQKPIAPQPAQEVVSQEIPEDLLCSICSDLLTDAVMIPCCGNSYCDECIRSYLLDSEEHECPDCHEKDISPGTLIPNRFLRNSVANFKNTTGYVKKPVYKQSLKRNIEEPITIKPTKESSVGSPAKVEIEEKTVISEADSTEQSKQAEPEVEVKKSPKEEVENTEAPPPGVSPEESPKNQQPIEKRIESSRERSHSSRSHKTRPREPSPRRHHRSSRRSPNYHESNQRSEERPGTPTVDEPGMAQPAYPPGEVRTYPVVAPPPMAPMMGTVPPMQGPPPGFPGIAFHPTNGPPPNFRLPPPGPAPPGYLPPGFQVPPRAMYEAGRAPMTGPPPMYGNSGFHQSGSRSHRDYGIGDRRVRGRTPSGVIDDPLAAFNRMLREKDERERRAKRNHRRSYSRSRSRSRSYSRSPRRLRSRSPRRRQSRSRSRSFSISRSRSRTFSGSPPFRDFSPPRRNKGPSRYRSPIRSPPRHRFKDNHAQDRFRDYERGYSRDREPHSRGEGRSTAREGRDEREHRDYGFYDSYEDRHRKGGSWGTSTARGGPPAQAPPIDYYQAPAEMATHAYQPTNRYPPPARDYTYGKTDPPNLLMNRRFDDVAPPGVEEPPIPGMENAPRFEDRFDRYEDKKRKERKSRSPEPKVKGPSPAPKRKSKSKDKDSPDKYKRRKRDTSPAEKDKKLLSDEDKSKKNKERKKKKDKKESEKKKRKEKKDKHRDKKSKDEKKEEPEVKIAEKVPEKIVPVQEPSKEEVVEHHSKPKEKSVEKEIIAKETDDFDDSENILEIHTTDLDLKTDLDTNKDMLAHLPEKSKWEFDEDNSSQTSPKDSSRLDSKSEKGAKVTNEVLKRAENAIFAKAINAIRPIEIKKISTDRAKLYSDEKEEQEQEELLRQVNLAEEKCERKKVEPPVGPPTRLSVKERLGVKIDDLDHVVKVAKSRSPSPFSRRSGEITRNYGLGERKVEVLDRRRRDRSRNRAERSRRDGRRDEHSRRDRRDKPESSRKHDDRKVDNNKSKPRVQPEEEKKDKRKRSKSRSDSEERRRKRKDKKGKKEKSKKPTEEKAKDVAPEMEVSKIVVEKRKPTIDEATFEPDYDLESEDEKEDKIEKVTEEKKSSSSSDSSDSSSEDEKKKKRHKKHKKKKSRKDSSSSSSDSESESSDDERKKKKHKKKQKKKKKSKHK